MEYVYATLLVHKAGKKVDEPTLKNVLNAAGVKPDDARIRALVSALESVNIDEALKKAAMQPVAAPAEKKEEQKEEKKSEGEEKKEAEAAAAGLSALFG